MSELNYTDIDQLPVPAWGLHCPQCEYLLDHLPAHRCPECGLVFAMADVLRSDVRVREPFFDGRELPVRDVGWFCDNCHAALAGATSHECPSCQTPCDPTSHRPLSGVFWLDAYFAVDMITELVEDSLKENQIPYSKQRPRGARAIGALYSPTVVQGRAEEIVVPSDFYFDVLYLIMPRLQRTQRRLELANSNDDVAAWTCVQCAEENPDSFDICWNCSAERPDPRELS